MDRKFTPGPWTVQISDSMFGCYYVDQICDKQALHPAEEVDAEDRANAQLIAAAPDLLDALSHVWSFVENISEDDPNRTELFFKAREIVRNVMDKALGREES